MRQVLQQFYLTDMLCPSLGQSSLLLTLLGELGLQSGERFLQGLVAYVPQEAWVVSGTLRYNVTMGAPYDENRYVDVIQMACLLEVREDVILFPHL